MLTAYTTLCVIGVLVASTILAGIGKKRKYQQRRPKEDHAALCPRCFYGYRRMTKSGTTYRPTCKKCAAHKKNGRTRRHSSSASASEEVGVAESSQQRNTGTSASTLRPSSGDIISPRPSHRGRAPRGRTWNGREHQPDHPTPRRTWLGGRSTGLAAASPGSTRTGRRTFRGCTARGTQH